MAEGRAEAYASIEYDQKIRSCIETHERILRLHKLIHQSTRNPGHVYKWGWEIRKLAQSLSYCAKGAREIVADYPIILSVRTANETLDEMDKTVDTVFNDQHPIMVRSRQEEDQFFEDKRTKVEACLTRNGWGSL